MRKPQTEKGIENQQLEELTPSVERKNLVPDSADHRHSTRRCRRTTPVPVQCNTTSDGTPYGLRPYYSDCEADNFSSPRKEVPPAQEWNALVLDDALRGQQLLKVYLSDCYYNGGCHLLRHERTSRGTQWRIWRKISPS